MFAGRRQTAVAELVVGMGSPRRIFDGSFVLRLVGGRARARVRLSAFVSSLAARSYRLKPRCVCP